MSFVAVAIGGAAVVGAGATIGSGMMQSNAAGKASAAQVDAINQGNATLMAGQRDALAYLDPFRMYGLNAGSALQAALYSPEQVQQQIKDQQIQLQGEIDRLQASKPRWDEEGKLYPFLTGKNASERRAQQFVQETSTIDMKIREAQAKLNTFNQQAQGMTERLSAGPPKIEASPWYQFQADLLGRTQDRAFAARGLTGSGFEAEERRRGLIELGAGETERQFSRLKGLYDVGANAANAGAGALTGTAQGISNNQVAAGNAQAQGIQGVAGANANMLTGISNATTGAVGAGLNYAQFQSLIAANKPVTPVTTSAVGGIKNMSTYYPPGGSVSAYG